VLFNSAAFAVFLPIVLVVYWSLRSTRQQNLFLLAASLFFYGWWDWRFLSLIALSTCVDYGCALSIERERERGGTGRRWVTASLVSNLGILGVFKYYDFFVESAEPLWAALGWRPDLLHVVLPIGISFYTFQTLSYTIDVYRGQFRARRSLLDVAAYVTFFPQLVAGPIERASRLLPQLERPRRLRVEDVRLGVLLIAVGLLKKVVIADGVAPVVDAVFADAGDGPVRPEHVLIATNAFALQIYGDFAGYSDVARGVARLLGIDLVVNFRQPYFSRRYAELFDRWHVSLSTWLRDYLFIPLGGSRGGPARTLLNLFLTMLLAGLWHGASWTFGIWGCLVGGLLVTDRLLPLGDPDRWSPAARGLGILLTFELWSLGAVFFRAPDLATASSMVQSLATGTWALPDPWYALALGLVVAATLAVDVPQELHPEEDLAAARHSRWRALLLAVTVVGFVLVRPLGEQPFIYFQF